MQTLIRVCTIVFYNNKYERASGWIKQSCEYAVKIGSGENDKKMESRSLAEGLGLSYGSDHFCIFREHRAGLWYVRKSDDIINNGMFVSLNGFEYQVYLDVQQVVDTAEGKYAKLNELLNGSGTPDLDVAWQEYRYKDLYAALEKFATPELFKRLKLVFNPALATKENEGVVPKTEEIFAEIKDAALAYYEKEAQFALESGEKAKTASQKAARSSKKASSLTPTQRFQAFCKQIEYLVATVTSALGLEGTESDPLSSSRARSNSVVKVTSNNLLYEGLTNIPCAAEILSAFAIVSSAGSENCQKWGYNRKLTELLGKADIRTPEMQDTFKRIFLLMRIRNLNFGASGQIQSTYEVAKFLVESEYASLLSGANEFNGVRWFNKEKMETTLWYAFAAIAMYSPRILREQIHRLYRTLSAAKDSSEYKCEKFTSAVQPVEKVKRTRRTKKSTETEKEENSSKKSAEDSANLEQK